MRGTIYFDGKSSADFGLIVEYFPESVHAARRGELIQIPGRNGVVVREDGAFDTYTQQYQVWFRNTMGRDTYQNARDVAEWLLSASGFCRLEDTYEPEYFRMARFVGPLNVETVLRDHGRATLEFDIQPQRYLKNGETPISYEGDSTTTFSITNPTQFEARPLLKFTDTSEEPQIETAALTMRDDYWINASGDIVPTEGYTGMSRVSQPVSVAGYAKVFVTGNGYAFLDSNGTAIRGKYLYTYSYHDLNSLQLLVPPGAASIVVSDSPQKPAALQMILPRPNPGNAAATINGTTINLDFSTHDTIYLDCDLHDAYYIDGSNANNAVSFSSNVDDYPTFPGLIPGENIVIPGDGTILDFEIVPRWWTL